jgi:hypothetical protein
VSAPISLSMAPARPPRKSVPLVKVPDGTAALLTEARKMPGLSWSLPAHQACPAQVTGPGSICGSCYAAKGRYRISNVAGAQRQRFLWAVAKMRTPEGRDEFVQTMVDAIARDKSVYFRVHDSGDLFNPAYVACWARIARAMPQKRFWIPTRTWRFLDRPAWRDALLELAGLPNVTMRPSALMFGDVPPIIPGMAAGTSAASEGFNCPAPEYGNYCGPCRACWDAPESARIYRTH